jgi:hypothetical protein
MTIFAGLRKATWSPYLGGVLLGLLVTASMAGLGHRLSGAGAYQALSGVAGKLISSRSIYWDRIVPPAVTWDVLVTLGAVFGAFASSRFGRSFRWRVMPDHDWTPAFGSSVALRWVIAFLGSMLTEIGAGLAGGCTASLVVSGGAVLSPAAFLFMAGMFAGGIPTLLLVDARTRGRS